MIWAIDFDGCLISQDRPYDDLETPLQLLPGARRALLFLKEAGHTLLLYSARARASLRIDPNLDPLVRAGARGLDLKRWVKNQPLNEARYQQMISFVEQELPGVFDAIDDGVQGKPGADIYLDDKALRLGVGPYSVDWDEVAIMYGERPMPGGSDGKEATG